MERHPSYNVRLAQPLIGSDDKNKHDALGLHGVFRKSPLVRKPVTEAAKFLKIKDRLQIVGVSATAFQLQR